mmetsp:Transcript_54345/g.107360  ORF Transcript_54345/g.107360 Transcript_54345/m.107360 type:complete len:205 (-) Transcript_54345:247-861(-)
MNSGTGFPASLRWSARCPSILLLGHRPRRPVSSASLKSHLASLPFGRMPQMSKFATVVFGSMTASNHLESWFEHQWCDMQGTGRSPGYFWPHPKMFAKSLADPRGIWANAGKLSAISSSVQMKPLPLSVMSGSSSRVGSAFSARNMMKRAKEPVPSPPPEMRRGRLPMALASSLAFLSSVRKTSRRPPRRWPRTTSMMLNIRSW